MTIQEIYHGTLAALLEQKYRYQCYVNSIEGQIARLKAEAQSKGVTLNTDTVK